MLAIAAIGLSIFASPLFPRALRFSAVLLPAWSFAIYVFGSRRGGISRLLAHPVLVRLGEVSFAFYLIHLSVIVLMTHAMGTDHPLFMAASFGNALALSFALFYGIERPLRERIRRALGSSMAAPFSAHDAGGRQRTPGALVPAVEQRGFHVQPHEAV